MIEPSETDWPPPKDWQKFERWVRDLFEAEWESRATMHGRSGQTQHGVDIYGQPKGGADWHGIQCKRVGRWAGKRVTAASLLAEVNKAKGFTPELSHFILATTGPRDAEVQRFARDITQRHQAAGLFSIEILFWEDFLDLYDRHRDVFSQHYGQPLTNIDLERRAVRVDQILALAERTPALSHLRPPPADFTGRRREIDQILDHVRETGTAIACVWGLAGVGKTSFARLVAEKLKTKFADGQIEIDMQGTSGQPLSVQKAMAYIIEALGGEVTRNERMLAGAYLSALANRHALLLLDNAASAEQVGPLLPPRQCGLLVTSRRHFLLPGAQVIDLKSFPDDDAKDFMLRIAPRVSGSVSSAIDLCGCLPLALRLVASALAVREEIVVSDFLQRLEDERMRLVTIDGYRELTEEPMGVEASLRLSYDLLSDELRKSWRLLSVIRGWFYACNAAEVWGEDPWGGDEATLQASLDHTDRTLGELVTYSLVDSDPLSMQYGLHELARVFGRLRLNSAESYEAHFRHAKSYLWTQATCEHLYLQGGDDLIRGVYVFQTQGTDILAAHDWIAEHVESDSRVAELCNKTPCGVGGVFRLRTHPDEQIRWAHTCLRAADASSDTISRIIHLSNLGIAYHDIGDFRNAIDCFERSLAEARKTQELPYVASALLELGNTYGPLGEPEKALEYSEEARRLLRDLGDEHNEANALGNMANALNHLRKPEEAAVCAREQLRLAEKVGDQRCMANAMATIGDAHLAQKDPKSAIEIAETALAIQQRIGATYDIATTLFLLGRAQFVLGNHELSKERFRESLKTACTIGDRRGQRNSWFWLGEVNQALGELPAARHAYEQSLAIAEEEGDHEATGTAAIALYALLSRAGDMAEALGYAERAVVQFRASGNRKAEGSTLINMGDMHKSLGEEAKTHDCYAAALSLAEEIRDKFLEGIALCRLGMIYADRGNTGLATDYFKRSLKLARDIKDKTSEATAAGCLGLIHARQHQHSEALAYYQKQLELVREMGDVANEGVALKNIASSWFDLGDMKQAVANYRQSVERLQMAGYSRIEGQALSDMGAAYVKLGETNEAIKAVSRAVQILESLGVPEADLARRRLNALRSAQ